MHKNMTSKLGVAAVAFAAICGGSWWGSTVSASDHDESPLVKLDAALDITDLYIFKSAADKTTIIVCWAGFNDSRKQPDALPVFDPNVLYTLHVDNNLDQKPDFSIYWRYGLNDKEQYGIQWEGMPGADPLVSGPVESIFDVGEFARAWTGHADDPFFFDAQGYLTALMTGTVGFDNKRDFLAGLNVTAAAIEIDTDLLTAGGKKTQIWVTASAKK